jgi:putative transposase
VQLRRERPSWGAPKIREKLRRSYCYPLTVSDFASRYLIACEALTTTQQVYAFTVFEGVFKESGLPQAIRTDNGVPFASPNALYRLSKLAVWWLRLVIRIERIKPGHPDQNARHERIHLTRNKEATKPAAPNFLQQQAKFDDFMSCYNQERPHQALDMKYPAGLYRPSLRPYRGLGELEYPFSRPNRYGHPLRAHLPRQAQDQPQPGLRRSERGDQGGER